MRHMEKIVLPGDVEFSLQQPNGRTVLATVAPSVRTEANRKRTRTA